MILIGLIFASGFRKKANYFSPSSSLVNFINRLWFYKPQRLPGGVDVWEWSSPCSAGLVSSGHQHSGLDMQKIASLRGDDTYWLLWEGVFHIRAEAFKCQFVTLVSAVLAVIFFSLDCWPLLLEPREDNSVPVSEERSDDTCLCHLTVGQEQSVGFNF